MAKKLFKSVKKASKPGPIPAAIAAAKRRKAIDIAIPASKLWVCTIGRSKIAFIKSAQSRGIVSESSPQRCSGHRDLPLGIIAKRKKRGKTEVLLTVRPFDSSEHDKVISHICN